MAGEIPTLVLYANRADWLSVSVDTVVRGLIGLKPERLLPAALLHRRLVRRVIGLRYDALSYIQDWQDAFCAAPQLRVETCNIANLVEFARYRRKIASYPLVIVLHSATGDSMSLLLKTADWFKKRRGKLLVFIGNEYNLMPAKIDFLRAVEADYIGSQFALETARWMYAECDRSTILSTPHALNPDVYFRDPTISRTVDVGFVGDLYPYYIGDIDRTRMIRYFQDEGTALGLTRDIRFQRLPRPVWAKFLNTCKAIVGAESGTAYLERTDTTINAVQEYVRSNPDATFDEVYERFFESYINPVSGKAISSRHFEPIGTKTCQILIEGHYNGILAADEHYIAVKKDLSNICEAVERFRDEGYRDAMTENTYEYVMAQHTYRHRVSDILGATLGA